MTSRYWLVAVCALSACAARHGFDDDARPDAAVERRADSAIGPAWDGARPDAAIPSGPDGSLDAGSPHDICRIEIWSVGASVGWLEWRLDSRGRFRSFDYSGRIDGSEPVHLEVSAWDEGGRATTAETTYEFNPPLRHERQYLPDGRPLSARDVGGEDSTGLDIDELTTWIYEAGVLREIVIFDHGFESSRSRIVVDLAARRATLTREGFGGIYLPGTETIVWNPDGTLSTFSGHYPETEPSRDGRNEFSAEYDLEGYVIAERLVTVFNGFTQSAHWTHAYGPVAGGVQHELAGGASPTTGFFDRRTLWLDDGRVRLFTTRDTSFMDHEYLELTGCGGPPVHPRVPWNDGMDLAPFRWAGAPLIEDRESFAWPEIMPPLR